MLPVLKEVGVVDSGGQGLVFVYEGFLESLSGKLLRVKFINQHLAKWMQWLMQNTTEVFLVL